jgi:hypothetical protein
MEVLRGKKLMKKLIRAMYVVRSQSLRCDIQKPRQMENAVRDI